ncbi:hypothetical protein EZV62_014401 [Acer yangbiense]|uniref:Uncharacterized protein n=1 Tax=Acer yangbiense TaxID=1000413 RepID=A0A5C7HSK5_9ROSI|nr:hypothetical protein EZV62_014401 [Acer yangbiense]
MSRCLQYPPPGYVRNGIRDEALIESIKLQREGEKAKKEGKKDKKREKKQKDKKEKEKSRGNGEVESKQHRHKKRHRDERSQENEKGRDPQNKTKNEKEQLENSGLTEEHGHPVGSQNSSDSTLNSQKRQKLNLSPDGGHNSGSIIRIRLPLQRQKDPDVLPNKEQPCTASESGRSVDASIQVMHEPALRPGREGKQHPCFTSTKGRPEVTSRHNDRKPCLSIGATESCAQMVDENPCLSTRATESCAQIVDEKPCFSTRPTKSRVQKVETSPALSLCGICPPDLTLKLRDVIGNWVPPSIQSDCTDFGDEEWLFESKQNQKCGSRRCEEDIVASSHTNTITWPQPQVCYLPEVDIYALPFTVPY